MATRLNTTSVDFTNSPSLPPALITPSANLYGSPVFHGYSLWLCPHNEDQTFLQQVISDTAGVAGTESFRPHLTVIAGIQGDLNWLLSKMLLYERRLSHNFDDIFVPSLDLHGLGARDLFFQCIYAHPDMSNSITMVNRLAVEVFEAVGNGCGYSGKYMPHLSLVYGDLTVSAKEAVLETLAPKVLGRSFNFGSLQLWRTEGLHTQWECVREVALPLLLDPGTLMRTRSGNIESHINSISSESLRHTFTGPPPQVQSHDVTTSNLEGEQCLHVMIKNYTDNSCEHSRKKSEDGLRKMLTSRMVRSKSISSNRQLSLPEMITLQKQLSDPEGHYLDVNNGLVKGAMKRKDVVEWATARKALIAAHRCAMGLQRGRANWEEVGNGKEMVKVDREHGVKKGKHAKKKAGGGGEEGKEGGLEEGESLSSSSSSESESDSESESSSSDSESNTESESDTDDERKSKANRHKTRPPLMTSSKSHGTVLQKNLRHGLLLSQLKMRSKETSINLVILQTIRDCVEIASKEHKVKVKKGKSRSRGQNKSEVKIAEVIATPVLRRRPSYITGPISSPTLIQSPSITKHPILTLISKYNFTGPILSSGMAWGVIGHAVKHLDKIDDRALIRRSSTGMINRYFGGGESLG